MGLLLTTEVRVTNHNVVHFAAQTSQWSAYNPLHPNNCFLWLSPTQTLWTSIPMLPDL